MGGQWRGKVYFSNSAVSWFDSLGIIRTCYMADSKNEEGKSGFGKDNSIGLPSLGARKQ